MAAYFSLVHQRGTIAVMDWLATQPLRDSTGTDSIPPPLLFLMPCHSTPFYSHLHRPTPMQFLDCSPPGWAHAVAQLNSHSVITPSAIISDDERILRADDFRKAPAEFLESLLSSSSSVGGASLPTHIIMFDAVTTQPGVVEALGEAGYQLYVQFFHSHFAVDQNGPQGRVVVFTPSVTPADEPSWRDNKELS
jgi:phosphatidylinositol glycan class B